MRKLALVLLCTLVLAPSADGSILLGLAGDRSRFKGQTTQRTKVGHVFLGWNQGYLWGRQFEAWFPMLAPTPMIGFGTKGKGGAEYITPLGIANGKGDTYLVDLNKEAAFWGGPLIVRPMAEMNGHWNYYCAYNQNGTSRGPSHSTKAFKNAFRRIYLIMHGGTRDAINAKLAKWGMPALKVGHDLPELPFPQMRVLWNPQGYGSPNLAGNTANSYYPGDSFVDIVGNDLYSIRGKAEWDANLKLYGSHPTKQYAIGEWGVWGIDDAAFIRRMASFVRYHRRTVMIAWYKSQSGSIFDLGNKPNARAAYRKYIVPLGG
jgi:Glycosyl hydrolase family 26